MLVCFPVRSLLEVPRLCLTIFWAEFVVFVFNYLSIDVSTNYLNVVFGNTTDKGRWLVAESDEFVFILGCTFSVLLNDFRTRGLRSSQKPPTTALTEFFYADTQNKHPSIAGIMAIFLYAILVSMVLYAYNVYIVLCRRCSLLRLSGAPRGVMVKAMACGIVVSEFVIQSRYYVHIQANTLGKGMNPLILPAMG